MQNVPVPIIQDAVDGRRIGNIAGEPPNQPLVQSLIDGIRCGFCPYADISVLALQDNGLVKITSNWSILQFPPFELRVSKTWRYLLVGTHKHLDVSRFPGWFVNISLPFQSLVLESSNSSTVIAPGINR